MADLTDSPSVPRLGADRSAKGPGRKRWEAADTVVAATVALLVVIFAVFGVLVWQALSNTVTQASERAEKTAEILAARTSFVVGAGRAFLDATAVLSDGEPGQVGADDLAALGAALGQLPADADLGLYNAAGRAVRTGPGLPDQIAGTPAFDALAGGEEWSVDTAMGGADLQITRRLTRDGAFSGVALLTISQSAMESFWSLMDLGEESTVSIVRSDGVVVARQPPLAAPLDLSGLPAFAALHAAESGSYSSERSPADGVPRVVGFRHLPDFGLIAIASLTTDAATALVWRSTFIVLGLLGPIGLALLIGSILTARLLRRSEANRRELADALAHNELLFKEIHHRIKNNLQSVNSLLQLQPIPKEVRTEMGRRIAAMSAVHEHIYRSGNFATVAVRDYLRTLIRDIQTGQGQRVEVVDRLDDLWVDKDIATPLALIVNEVLSNAFKHAFADGRDGRLTVTLVRDADGLGHLTVHDNGVGFDPVKPSKGIGQRLITALTRQIGGSANYASDGGSRFDLTFPLAASKPPAS